MVAGILSDLLVVILNLYTPKSKIVVGSKTDGISGWLIFWEFGVTMTSCFVHWVD